MMTRKDYVAVSAILKEYQDAMFPEDYTDLVSDFANYMKQDNERFDYARFQIACGLNDFIPVPLPKAASTHVSLS